MLVRWTSDAAEDLDAIVESISETRPDAAANVARRVVEAASALEVFPRRGRLGKIPETYEPVVSPLPYIIAYRLSEHAATILRVYHGAQDRLWGIIPGMDVERIREFLLNLPLVEETSQWGNNLVFWVGDKAVGGKMFALLNLDADGRAVMSFSAGPERFHELLENDGVVPAPYMARIHWVALERWGALPGRELQELLRDARDLTYAKLPQRTKDVLALPRAEFLKLLKARKELLAEKAERETARKAAAKTAAAVARKSAKKALKKASRSQ